MLNDLLLEVRRLDNLYNAWSSVRANIMASHKSRLKSQLSEISKNPIKYLRKIQKSLQKKTFEFSLQHGILKDGKRPLVIAPIENRIVQRAILNVLQSEKKSIKSKLGKIPEVLNTQTSIGGIPKKGVPDAIKLIQNAIENGSTHYLRSDIEKFFTKIPKNIIFRFILEQTNDQFFSKFFEAALSTELDNEDEIKEFIHLFPINDTGVPQGSSLSALAGNIVLQEFDREMNGRGITTIRYIDDFVILGNNQKSVRKAFNSAIKILNEIGMHAYDPQENAEKASIGTINNGFDFLGCTVKPHSVSPSSEAKTKFIKNIRDTLKNTDKEIEKFFDGTQKRKTGDVYIQCLTKIDKKIKGWADAFIFCDDTLYRSQMDIEIDKIITKYRNLFFKKINSLSVDQKRRMLGITLLKDIEYKNH